MIGLSELKKKLGKTADELTDQEIEKVRELFYQFSEILFDFWRQEKMDSPAVS